MMTSLLPFSVCRRMVGEGLHWNQIKPHLFQQRKWFSSVQQSKTSKSTAYSGPVGPEGQTAPEKFDGGDYDEGKNEEYEHEAEQRAMRYRRIKKVLSTGLFVSVLGFVGYSRRGKRDEIANNIKNAKFLTDDGLFKGSERLFCLYERSKPKAKVVLPASIVKDGTIGKIGDFHLRDDDIIVASFPKAGTTWLQEIVYLINNGLDFTEASKQVLETRFPFLEYPFPGLSSIEKMPSPRLIKTHLPFDFLPKTASNAKIIYIARNPKDVVVSYYHFSRMFAMSNFVGSFREFLEKFEKDELPYCPFFEHVESYVRQKEDPNVLILTYESLKKDPAEVIEKVAQFLGKSLSQEDIKKLVDHTRFENMAKNASVNYEHWDDIGFRIKNEAKFMRKGKIGDWKNFLNREDNAKFEEWIRSGNKVHFPFVYEGE